MEQPLTGKAIIRLEFEMQESPLVNDVLFPKLFDNFFVNITNIIGLTGIRSILTDLLNQLLNYLNQLIHTRV
eukprot:s1095_g3.t1